MKTVFVPFMRLASFLWLLALGLMPHASCLAAPSAPPLDLGHGLTYVRLQDLPDDFARLSAVWSSPALIIDLRYPTEEGTRVMGIGLPARPRTTPLFVLVGPATTAVELAVLREFAPALITIGLAAPGLTPDIALPLSPEADRRAYDALATGASAESLISENTTKHRFDEAALARDRDNGAAENEEPGPAGADQSTTLPAAGTPPAPAGVHPTTAAPEKPLKDLVLQRAVQLHRALLALGKLPHG
jgi:hypothetical protein